MYERKYPLLYLTDESLLVTTSAVPNNEIRLIHLIVSDSRCTVTEKQLFKYIHSSILKLGKFRVSELLQDVQVGELSALNLFLKCDV